ncbi:MAG: PEP-CTERM sorting domain-containing protein [Planctomycetota bacterium]|nr:PEP-CTERM sorting domain-containing protein [Planctomycetota bacterium]
MVRLCLKSVLGLLVALGLTSSAGAGPVNLISNGDFESGNTLFASDYNFSPASNPTERQYAVLTNPFPWNPNFISTGDHTTGSGQMFVGNGSGNTSDKVWYTNSVAVSTNTDYYFEAFVMNVDDTTKYPPGANPQTFSILSFYANGMLLGTRTTNNLGIWEGLSTTWNSVASTTVDLVLMNANDYVEGNDFAIDDIYLGVTSTVPATPEPSTMVLALLGGVGAVLARRRRSKV